MVTVGVLIEQHPGGSFRRELLISRVSNNDVIAEPGNDPLDLVSDYEVVLGSGRGRNDDRATFQHRFGDDLLVLLTEAIAALGGKLPETKRRDAARAALVEVPS